jgi:Spy/CpxP family protein refolding chaperone
MRSLSTKMLAVAVVALLVSPAFAQRQGGGRQGGRGGFGGFGGFGGGMQGSMLLLNKSVQDELKLTDEQKAELKKIQEKQREVMREVFQGGGRDFAKAREAMQKANEEATKAADKVKDALKPEQAKRLKQIQLQVGMQFNPLSTLTNADVQKDLGLTDKQKQDLKALADDTRKDMEEVTKDLRTAGRDREKRQQIMQKVQALNKEATGKAKAILTDDQKKTLTELEGAKFEYRPDFGGGRRRQQQ